MTNFLVISKGNVSEWMSEFSQVQNHMNELEKSGFVSSVKVQKFSDMVLEKEINYNFNGESWEK